MHNGRNTSPRSLVSLTVAPCCRFLADASFGCISSTGAESQSFTLPNVEVILFPDVDDLGQKVFGEFLRISGKGPAISGFFDQHLVIDAEDLASKIEVPTYVVHARDDVAVPLEAGRILASLIRGAKFEIVEGGHNSGVGGTPLVRRKILDFIEGHQRDMESK